MAPAQSLEQMQRIVLNDYVNTTLAALFMSVVLALVVLGLRAALIARRSAAPTVREVGHVVAA